MGSTDDTYKYISCLIEDFKIKINVYDDQNKILCDDIETLSYIIQRQSNDLQEKLLNISSDNFNCFKLFSKSIFDDEMFDNEIKIDLVRFSSVLQKMDDKIIVLKEHINLFKVNVVDKLNDKDECSDSESCGSDVFSNCSKEVNPVMKFYFKRKDKHATLRKMSCMACHCEIQSESYLTTDNSSCSLHIARKCVQSNGDEAVDFSRAKCFVYKQLRNHDELKQLLACGFYYNKITGFKPQNVALKGFCAEIRNSNVTTSKECQFTYRRKDPSKKPTIVCVTCKKPIYGTTYLTCGGSMTMPIHIKKDCVQCDDFSLAKCFVSKFLRHHNDLRKLMATGFCFHNIIGVIPQNTDLKVDAPEAKCKDDSPIVKDNGFIFNEEPFTCEELPQNEKCQGCLKIVKKTDLCLRHKERVPREKLSVTPLISQYYHTENTCLLTRGFTANYLSMATCHIIISHNDHHQNIEHLLVKCGLSCRNIKYGPVCQDNIGHATSSSATVRDSPARWYFFVVTCTKVGAHCAGCGFNIDINKECLVHGVNVQQNESALLYHISKWCLRCRFTEGEISDIICENNNSMADVSDDMLRECGIVDIRQRVHCGSRGGRPQQDNNPFLVTSATRFTVDLSTDSITTCQACHESLPMDRYVLRAVRDGSVTVTMHLEAKCVRQCGFMPQEVCVSDLTLSVSVSLMARAKLNECGFWNIPPPQ